MTPTSPPPPASKPAAPMTATPGDRIAADFRCNDGPLDETEQQRLAGMIDRYVAGVAERFAAELDRLRTDVAALRSALTGLHDAYGAEEEWDESTRVGSALTVARELLAATPTPPAPGEVTR